MQMDTVTYPDESLTELLAQFVLIKVDHDAEPALAKQYAVQPLPDVRLLAPDGKPLDKLLGFTSATKLATRLQTALDRLAGHAPPADDHAPDAGREATATSAVEPTPDAVGLAVLRGASFLRNAWRSGWTAAPRFAPDEIVLYAWACTGLRRSDADVAALLAQLVEVPPPGTYRAALRACALARLDAVDLRPKMEECARFLETSQLANGQWTYGPAEPDDQPVLGDHSNSAYALLGLAACQKSGVDVSHEAIAKAATWWLHAQNEDGGFGYRADRESQSYASMTASGLHGLLLARDRFGSVSPGIETNRGVTDPTVALSAATARASTWLHDHFSVRENRGSAYQEGRLLYGLYAVERVGDAEPAHGAHRTNGLPDDWYRQGAAYLLSTQHDDGSWDDGAETSISNTCFALLFLTRASEALR